MQNFISQPTIKNVHSEVELAAKARYFRSIGYTAENADDLADSLVVIARSEGVFQEIASDFGTKYVIDGEFFSPIGTSAKLRTVWVIDPQDARPRFVTAYPT